MIKYEIVQQDAPMGFPSTQIVLIYREDGSIESFPVDKDNFRYREFLTEIGNSTEL